MYAIFIFFPFIFLFIIIIYFAKNKTIDIKNLSYFTCFILYFLAYSSASLVLLILFWLSIVYIIIDDENNIEKRFLIGKQVLFVSLVFFISCYLYDFINVTDISKGEFTLLVYGL
jgi:hypothetical protein